MITIRPFQPEDWNVLLDLAHQAVPFEPKDNEAWLGYRKAFDESTRIRRHYLAVEDGIAVGYGGLEQQEADPKRLRMYTVCSPQNQQGEVGDRLCAQLFRDAQALGATQLWAREYQADPASREFFTRHGFVETERFTVPNHSPLVIYQLDL